MVNLNHFTCSSSSARPLYFVFTLVFTQNVGVRSATLRKLKTKTNLLCVLEWEHFFSGCIRMYVRACVTETKIQTTNVQPTVYRFYSFNVRVKTNWMSGLSFSSFLSLSWSGVLCLGSERVFCFGCFCVRATEWWICFIRGSWTLFCSSNLWYSIDG